MKDHKFPVILVTLYLVVFAILSRLDIPLNLMLWLFAFSPLLVIWMVYRVIRYGKYTGKELKPGEEWGYEDKNRDELGTF
jgi:hypothetical protein